MNDNTSMSHRRVELDTLQARYALRVTACLSEQAEGLGHDVSERLRYARTRAVQHARAVHATRLLPAGQSSAVSNGSALVLGSGPRQSSPWWVRLASVLPLVVLVAGLVLIQSQHAQQRISAIADVDLDLLLDDLPPTAYRDPGFVEFLKSPLEQ